MHALTNAVTLAVLAAPALGHMMMIWPPALRAPENPQYNGSSVDHSYVIPLTIDGSNFPCKGYHTDVPSISTATATLEPGSNFTVSLKGLTTYQGGSCQFSLSYDSGATWGAIESIIGNCPTAKEIDYTFRVPAGLPDANNVLFAWTWFNNVGNREMYMNCASVDVVGAPGSQQEDYTAQRMFEANIFGSSCFTKESEPVDFANPVLQSCPPELLVTPDQTVTFSAVGSTVPIPTDMEDMPMHTGEGHSDVPPTATATATATSSSNSTVPAPTNAPAANTWVADRVFVSGDAICESGVSYTAKWWTKGDKPGTSSVWTKGGAC